MSTTLRFGEMDPRKFLAVCVLVLAVAGATTSLSSCSETRDYDRHYGNGAAAGDGNDGI